jgi:hypothetical protein
MTTLEPALRRPEFSEGLSFIGSDDGRWYLPILDESALERHPEIRDYFIATQESMGRGSKVFSAEIVVAIQKLGTRLLMENYNLVSEEYAQMIMDPYGITSSLATNAIFRTISSPVLYALVFMDHNGIDRSESARYLLAMSHPNAKAGWGNHDGIMFNN